MERVPQAGSPHGARRYVEREIRLGSAPDGTKATSLTYSEERTRRVLISSHVYVLAAKATERVRDDLSLRNRCCNGICTWHNSLCHSFTGRGRHSLKIRFSDSDADAIGRQSALTAFVALLFSFFGLRFLMKCRPLKLSPLHFFLSRFVRVLGPLSWRPGEVECSWRDSGSTSARLSSSCYDEMGDGDSWPLCGIPRHQNASFIFTNGGYNTAQSVGDLSEFTLSSTPVSFTSVFS